MPGGPRKGAPEGEAGAPYRSPLGIDAGGGGSPMILRQYRNPNAARVCLFQVGLDLAPNVSLKPSQLAQRKGNSLPHALTSAPSQFSAGDMCRVAWGGALGHAPFSRVCPRLAEYSVGGGSESVVSDHRVDLHLRSYVLNRALGRLTCLGLKVRPSCSAWICCTTQSRTSPPTAIRTLSVTARDAA